MNRSNVGNVVTNGMQILSISGTTGAKAYQQSKRQRIADASSGLNNLDSDEVRQLGEIRANEMRETIRQSSNKVNGMNHLTDDEQQKFGEKKADDLRKYINESEEENEATSVDDLMKEVSATNSPQTQELSKKIIGDIEYTQRWVGRNTKTGRMAGFLKDDKGGEE